MLLLILIISKYLKEQSYCILQYNSFFFLFKKKFNAHMHSL